MGIFDGLKKFKRQLERVESSVFSGKQSLIELYELNVKLEAEIKARTRELDTANKQMLTLQHIWDMMNSSKPLSSVLNAIVSSLQGELGYHYSCIVKKMTDKDVKYLQMLACSGKMFCDVFKTEMNCDSCEVKFKSDIINEMIEHIDKNEIYQSKNIDLLLDSMITNSENTDISSALYKTDALSYISIPLKSNHVNFGSLIVFSSRDDATENELKFLRLFSQQIELAITIANLFQVVKEQATTDSMTGLYNRRYFEESIQKEVVRAKRQNQKFTIIGIDLDHLKRINDAYGHNYGDIAIKTISEVLKNSCRSIDIAARIGGEEFNVILQGVDSQGGMIFAERIRKAVECIELEKIGHITASIGVGTYMEHSSDPDELLELVDHAMYESKRNGRNRVTLAKPTSETSWQEVAIDTFIAILSKHRIPLDKKTATMLNKKLNSMNLNNEILYQVSDALVTTYNPDHEKGGAKKKVLLATLIAKRFDLPKESIDNLKIATLLYDIGNTLIPKDILSKTEPLNEDEISSIKKHPIIAAKDILEPISRISDIIPIIEKHHENWDGSGYPKNISHEDIPIESQIILIVDSYFALMENRPYRNALSKEDAIKVILSEADNKWSKALADEFISVINYEDFND